MQTMARIVQGLRCMVNRSFLVARVTGQRNIFQHRSMHHYGLSSATGGFIAPSLIKTVQVKSFIEIHIQYFSKKNIAKKQIQEFQVIEMDTLICS